MTEHHLRRRRLQRSPLGWRWDCSCGRWCHWRPLFTPARRSREEFVRHARRYTAVAACPFCEYRVTSEGPIDGLERSRIMCDNTVRRHVEAMHARSMTAGDGRG